MTVETATKISQLNPLGPPGSDPKSEGDNHLRLLKSCLQAVFDDSGTTLKTTLPIETPGGKLTGDLDANGKQITNVAALWQRGFFFGCGMANNGTAAIDIAPGTVASDAAIPTLINLGSVLTKRLDAVWTVGSGNGGLDGGVAANGWYYLWLIRRSDSGVVDALYSLSATAPTMPASYDQKAYVGPVLRAAAVIRTFVQDKDDFWWKDNTASDFNQTNPGTTGTLRVVSAPTAFSTMATITIRFSNTDAATPSTGYLSSPLVNDDPVTGVTPNIPTAGLITGNVLYTTVFTQVRALTDTAGRIRTRLNFSNANVILQGNCVGFTDKRGRL